MKTVMVYVGKPTDKKQVGIMRLDEAVDYLIEACRCNIQCLLYKQGKIVGTSLPLNQS